MTRRLRRWWRRLTTEVGERGPAETAVEFRGSLAVPLSPVNAAPYEVWADVALSGGTRLGPYEILGAIGAGGMGEVYKARDTRLDRTVAIKVLPAHVASDPDLRARFEREARAVAALQHPHICTLFDVGEAPSPEAPGTRHTAPGTQHPAPGTREGATSSDKVQFLVLEYLDGETLAQRLAKGPLPLDQALHYAIQIADALDKAHRQGITHRDLKPGNVMLTKVGAKLLDFGLAKLGVAPTSALTGLSAAVTREDLTAHGMILGTFQYMAPEQLEGKDADSRTDIFAFGAVLYEMLTGKRAFEGKSQASLIAAILERDPPSLSELQPLAPPALDHVVKTCLTKDPDGRWQSAADVMRELKWIAEGGSQGSAAAAGVVAPRKGRLSSLRLASSIAVLAFAIAAAVFALRPARPLEPRRVVRLAIDVPASRTLQTIALAPDGSRLAYVATESGRPHLYVRAFDRPGDNVLAGTDDARLPFWSPDSRVLGFFAQGKLKKIDVSGGSPTTLCDVPAPASGAWGSDGVILFAVASMSAVQKVSASGGAPTAATALGEGEEFHLGPMFLPDGRHFLYVAQPTGAVYVASLDSTERARVLEKFGYVSVAYSEGHLLFRRRTTLMAQPFDADRRVVTGDAVPVEEESAATSRVGQFSVSANGVLAYQTLAMGENTQLAWFDRTGQQTGVLGEPGDYADVQLSPDGKRAAVSVLDPDRGTRDIWVFDVARGLRTRFTFDPSEDFGPIWSPDGARIVFASRRGGKYSHLYEKASNGASAEQLVLGDSDSANKLPYSWSPDGRFIAYMNSAYMRNGETSVDVWALPLGGDRKPFAVVQTPFIEARGMFSPDGRWMAYQSNESGRAEVQVVPFPGPGGKWQVSTAGGTDPRWRGDGREFFYLDPTLRLMVAEVKGDSAGFEVSAVRALFQTRARTGLRFSYDVSADGQRFLINSLPASTDAPPFTVVFNWTAGLQRPQEGSR